MKSRKWISLALITLLILAVTGCNLTRWGYESAPYTLLRKSGPFEIRSYPAITLVSTPMDTSTAQDQSFIRLFRYISGSNQSTQKIAMTVPVFSTPSGSNLQMSFVLPKETAAQGPPQSTRDDVLLQTRAGGQFASYRFSGSSDGAKFRAASEKLAAWIAAQNLLPLGEPTLANYDPPFTPPFLRRNEILVRLKHD